ncbi:MAG: TadE/TadG family type IV pilus assembly protein [Pseudobdellovibrionaceae bacterium]
MISSLRRFFFRTEGATAVEFALVAVPFTFLLMGIIEVSLFFAASAVIQGATTDAARLIRTGQVQNSENQDPEEMFAEKLCDAASVFAKCDNLKYEVVQMDSYADFSAYPPTYDENGVFQSNGFTTGGSNDIVMVRTVYRYKLMIPIIAQIFQDPDRSDGTRLIMSTVIFQTEPYALSEAS